MQECRLRSVVSRRRLTRLVSREFDNRMRITVRIYNQQIGDKEKKEIFEWKDSRDLLTLIGCLNIIRHNMWLKNDPTEPIHRAASPTTSLTP